MVSVVKMWFLLLQRKAKEPYNQATQHINGKERREWPTPSTTRASRAE
jgi:hypothetical protein